MKMVHFISPEQRIQLSKAALDDRKPVLLVGESGTGKGALANWIHQQSARSDQPLLTIDLRNSPPESIPDLLIQAGAGTVVIHEIGSWPLREQKTVLQLLETHSVATLPDPEPRRLVQARVIATTGHDLAGRVAAGLFNAELLRRLSAFKIEIPNLKSRKDELPQITETLLQEIVHDLRKSHLRGISPEVATKFAVYDWPANLRELRNVLKLAAARATGDSTIEIGDLPDFGAEKLDFHATREQFEKIYLCELLKSCRGNLKDASRASRIELGMLVAKMNQYGIEPHSFQ